MYAMVAHQESYWTSHILILLIIYLYCLSVLVEFALV